MAAAKLRRIRMGRPAKSLSAQCQSYSSAFHIEGDVKDAISETQLLTDCVANDFLRSRSPVRSSSILICSSRSAAVWSNSRMISCSSLTFRDFSLTSRHFSRADVSREVRMAVGQVSKRLLVVEDEFLIARDIEKMLGDLGIEVVGPACSRQSALYLARNENLNGAILDVNLGDGSYVNQVVDVLSERSVPFVYAAAYRLEGTDVLPVGCLMLAKPYSVEQLRDVIGIMLH